MGVLTFLTLCTGVGGGIGSAARTFATPNRTISQPSDNTDKEAVSLAEVKPWLLEERKKLNQRKKKETRTFLCTFVLSACA